MVWNMNTKKQMVLRRIFFEIIPRQLKRLVYSLYLHRNTKHVYQPETYTKRLTAYITMNTIKQSF